MRADTRAPTRRSADGGFDGRRVRIRHVAFTHTRGGCGRRTANVEQILDRDRNAVQRSAVLSVGDLPVGLSCLTVCGR